jgi:hypothetical protein
MLHDMKTNTLKSCIALGCGLGLLITAGCTTTGPKVETEFDAAASFASAKTYTLLPLPDKVQGADPGAMMRVGPAIVNAVDTAMLAHGYKKSDTAESADLAVLVHGQKVPKTNVTDWGGVGMGVGYGFARYPYAGGVYGSNITVDQYEEGTLAIEVYDVKTRKQIWVGWTTGRATTDTSQQADRVSAAVTQVLAKYPPVGEVPAAEATK